jgi:protein involved in polysaccharide export with SLBB domain
MTMRLGTLVVLLGMLTGCASRGPDQTSVLSFLRDHEHQVSAIEYRVGIPDAVALSAPSVPEIDRTRARVQPDGKITLDLIGEVSIVGMTAKEIAAKLEVLASRYYVDPQISVRVAEYASKKYYVTGQVFAQGPRVYTGRDTLLDAVLQSGVNFMSWTGRVTVTRPSRDAAPPEQLRVDVYDMIRNGRWDKNILLEPDDIVYVPATPLAWVGLRLREVLFPVSPVVEAYQAPARVLDADYMYSSDYRERYETDDDDDDRGLKLP